ncbi:hypothetical protein [Selenomonas sp. oral taxon 126]|uniref:hypothetical protein n=1 Tax=Selenomonas sp. oral taxon 126 TaxID=712528 RepID=UPI001561AC64|nr:hypothetical protein [Selenomonas sp. oral taxon 126]DAF19091.1 MAG TPA: hypothetical protein [Caudoviricetes sp.]
MSDKKKAGRPVAGTPKTVKLTVRVDEEAISILDSYCEREKVSRADGVRTGIKTLKDK